MASKPPKTHPPPEHLVASAIGLDLRMRVHLHPTDESRASVCRIQGARRNLDFQCEQRTGFRIREHLHKENESCARVMVTAEDGATRLHARPTWGFPGPAPRNAVEPVQAHHVVDDLLHQTLQDLFLGENRDRLHAPPALPCRRHRCRDPTTASPACLLLDGEASGRNWQARHSRCGQPCLGSHHLRAHRAQREGSLRDAATVT